MTTVLSILGSVGLFTFLQFLITRHDNKKGTMAWMKEEIVSMRADMKRDKADDARRRILTAADELRCNVTLHSLEWFNQLNEDIDRYEKYCDKHPDYSNNKALQSIEYIKRNYAKRLEKNDFL